MGLLWESQHQIALACDNFHTQNLVSQPNANYFNTCSKCSLNCVKHLQNLDFVVKLTISSIFDHFDEQKYLEFFFFYNRRFPPKFPLLWRNCETLKICNSWTVVTLNCLKIPLDPEFHAESFNAIHFDQQGHFGSLFPIFSCFWWNFPILFECGISWTVWGENYWEIPPEP